MEESRLREALVKWFTEVYDSYNRGNLLALAFRDTAINMFRAVISTPNLLDYLRELYFILKEAFEGGG